MTLVDTSVWIDFFNGVRAVWTDRLAHLLENEPVLLGDLIYCEVLQGFRYDRDVEAARRLLRNLRRVQLVDFEIAEEAAANFRRLRRQGITVRKTVDMIIATWCVENDVALLHNDRDFSTIAQHLPLREDA
jgi:predicted nucleic acid-binding protein